MFLIIRTLVPLISSPPLATTRAQTRPASPPCAAQYFAGPSGGYGGGAFTDPELLLRQATVVGVAVRSGVYVDGIQLIYRTPDGRIRRLPWHGGRGGSYREFWLRPGEVLTGISGRSGAFVDSLRFETSFGRRSPTYGGRSGSTTYRFGVPQGYEISGFFGRSGVYIDALGILYYSTGCKNI
jgi:hypothetical protein